VKGPCPAVVECEHAHQQHLGPTCAHTLARLLPSLCLALLFADPQVRYNPLFPKFLPGAPPAYMQLVRDATSSSLVRRPKFEAIIRTLEELQMSSGGARSGPLLPPSLSRGLSHASARNSGHAQPKQA
jgi:hypothetical protein